MNDRSFIRIKNEISEIDKVSQIFNNLCVQYQLPEKINHAFDLVLDEILNNIINYGYDDQNEHAINIEIRISDSQVTLIIEDDGRQFNPLDAPEADTQSPLEERRIGGLGIHLVKTAINHIHYKYENNKNCLTIKKDFREK